MVKHMTAKILCTYTRSVHNINGAVMLKYFLNTSDNKPLLAIQEN